MLFTRSTKNTIEIIKDKYSIKELIEFERFCRDNELWDEMGNCYLENSRVDVSWFHGTGEEFVNASTKMKAYAPHKLYNTVIELKADKAVAVTMAIIQTRVEIDGTTWDLQSDLKLLYCLEKVDSDWFIVSFKGIYEKDILLPYFSNKDDSVPKDIISKFRPSYANLSYVLSKGGSQINMDLPGIDRPEMIKKLYSEVEEWLHN